MVSLSNKKKNILIGAIVVPSADLILFFFSSFYKMPVVGSHHDRVFVLLKIFIVLAVSSVEASIWSYLTGEKEDSDSHIPVGGSFLKYNNGNVNDYDELVSPIVNREIKVAVKAPWPSSSKNSVLCEAFAFLNGNNENHAFLDALIQSHGRDHLVSFERSTKYALELAREMAGLERGDEDEELATTTNLRLLKVALMMRAMSPTCELHRSLAHDRYPDLIEFLEAFAVIPTGDGDEIIIQISADLPSSKIDLPMLKKSERNALLLPNEKIRIGSKIITVEDDKTESADDELCMTFVILYANLGGLSFPTFYRSLVENEIPVVVRHLGGNVEENQEETTLQGYGVRLDIRNVEYKVFDDKKSSIVNDSSTEDLMINLSKLDTDHDSDNDDTCVNNQTGSKEQLTPHFLAGVNFTALRSKIDGDVDHSDENSFYELQRIFWKIHGRFAKHSQLIPPAWQRRRLSVQSATVIAHSRDPLATLQDLSQNLPSMSSTLVHVKIPVDIDDVAESMENYLQRLVRTSGGGLWINGRTVNVDRPSFNVFEMIKLLKDEMEFIGKLESRFKPLFSRVNSSQGIDQIRNALIEGDAFFTDNRDEEGVSYKDDDDDKPESHNSNSKVNFRIDLASGDATSVIYMNDLEKDMGYSRWSDSVNNMMMAMQYGMPPSVRRNLFTMLVVTDPLEDETDKPNVGQVLVNQLAQQEFPIRLAMVVVSQSDVDACTQLFFDGKPCSLSENKWLDLDDSPSIDELKQIKLTTRDIHRLYAFMRQSFAHRSEILIPYQSYLGSNLRQSPPSNMHFYSIYDLFTVHNKILLGLQIISAPISIEEIAEFLQENEEDSKLSYEKAVMFAVEKGIKPGMSFINGRPLPIDMGDADKFQTIFSEEQELVFKMIMEKQITDSKPRNFYYKLIKGKKRDVFPRLHPLLTDTESRSTFIDIEHNFGINSLLTPQSAQISPLDANAVFVFEAVLELNTPSGLRHALNFLTAMDALPASYGEVKIVAKYRIIPSTPNSASISMCNLLNSIGQLGYERTKAIFEQLLNENSEAALGDYATETDRFQCHKHPYLREKLVSKNFITANGRVYNIENSSVTISDMDLLTTISLDSSKMITSMLKPYIDDNDAYDAIAKATAFLLREKNVKKRFGPLSNVISMENQEEVDGNPLRFSWNQDAEGFQSLRTKVTAIVDPTTETAQRVSPLLIIIRDELKLHLDLILAPRMELNSDSDIPISSYYRFVADPYAYQEIEGDTGSPMAHFSNLPTDQILTLRMVSEFDSFMVWLQR